LTSKLLRVALTLTMALGLCYASTALAETAPLDLGTDATAPDGQVQPDGTATADTGPADDGQVSADGTAAADGSTTADSGTTKKEEDEGCSCVIGAGGSSGANGALILLGLALMPLLVLRRRR
jgi:hypothetical protein